MAALTATTIAAIGAGVTAASAVGQFVYSRQATAASVRAERLRKKQMRMDAARQRREIIRQSILANSMATARSVAQGVGEGSSVLFGAYGQTAGETGRRFNYSVGSEQIGASLFDANADYATAKGNAATFQSAGQFGNQLMSNAQTIYNIGTTLFKPNRSVPNNWGATVTYGS